MNNLKDDFFNNISEELGAIKKEISKSSNRLFALVAVLILLGIGIWMLIDKQNIPRTLFMLYIFFAGMTYYVGLFALKYEYKGRLERDIFPKILSNIQPNAKLSTYDNLNDDMRKSKLHLMANLSPRWAFNYDMDEHHVKVALYYQPSMEPAPLSFVMLTSGLFISITNVTFPTMPLYIYHKKFIPSLSQLYKQVLSDLDTNATLSNTHTVISEPLNDVAKAKVLELIQTVERNNTSISFIEDTAYILISEQVDNCFDPDNFTKGVLPTPLDYKGLNNILKFVQTITSFSNSHG